MAQAKASDTDKVLSIADNVRRVRTRMRQAAERAGRDPMSVRLVAASKTVDAARIRAAISAGVTILGENYLQETRQKLGQTGRAGVEWHLIGPLQRNKVRYVFDLFDMMHSLDRLELAEEINRRAERLGRRLSVLLEVNVGGETSKSGWTTAGLLNDIRQLAALPHIQVRGLMTIPPPTSQPHEARPFFRQLRQLRDRLAQEGYDGMALDELSMGMTADYEVAIEEGATLVRVGTAIFGPRPERH